LTVAYLGPYPTSRQSPQMRLLPHNSLHRHSSIVTMASLDPAPASQPSLQALNFLKSTSPGPAPATHWLPKGQLLPHGHLPRPSSCFTVAQNCLKSSFPGPPSASQWPGQAQLLRDNGLSRPSFCLTEAFPKQGPTCLPAASTGPDPASH
ncbi:putative uncharacterized protein FLJ46235, partial [Pongo abelii]|uniref:putative uncharacterized protein FLJ46235 n=1 Tax=Pongo abelii TaxID=9601 RepID=UPI0030074CA1